MCWCATRAGVISEPEVCVVDLDHGDGLVVLGSDGLFEFMDDQEVVDIVSSCSDNERACSKVCPHALYDTS
jgi:serine/threonine protein phosphatase PrpC